MHFKYIINTPLYKTFSDLGKRIFLPDGIFYWSGRAKKEAELIGTIGSAYGFEKDFIDGGTSEWVPCYLKDIKKYTSININDIVSYAAIAGVPEIRETWKNWIIKKSEYDKTRDIEKLSRLEEYITTPIITSGVTNGIFLSCSLFLNPGEYIISPNKRWGNYDNIIIKNIGAKIKSFEFFKDNEINIQGLREAIEEVSKIQNKIVIILNFPNNPTGYIPSLKETKQIIDLLEESHHPEKPIIVLVDDAYEPYVFRESVLKKSIFYDLHELEENIIPVKLDGITKELLLYGGRIGFFTLGLKPNWVKNEEDLEILKNEINNKLEGITRSTVSNCNHFYQTLTQKIFEDNTMEQILDMRNKVKNLLALRYEKINSELNKIDNPNITVDPNSGGFFIFANLNPNKVKASEFADHLLKKYKVGVIPIEKPTENINGIRIAYCSIDLEKIPEFVKRINLALKDFN
ncbi:MAG: aminotransferase class I/II-fold pyridoxal phosphate-dependent enzyme [Promethearchaeota archaeon]|nr:MAG: aminotransferase class I/II-fold pyridoxal phosphate-dependent enzyme [Candidatus Lokiarchaeota archaeon]